MLPFEGEFRIIEEYSPEDRPAFCTMNAGFFTRVNRLGAVLTTQPLSNALLPMGWDYTSAL